MKESLSKWVDFSKTILLLFAGKCSCMRYDSQCHILYIFFVILIYLRLGIIAHNSHSFQQINQSINSISNNNNNNNNNNGL